MISVDLVAVLASVAFVGAIVGSTLLASDGLGLDRRAAMLERRDPGTAEALRRAGAIGDYSRGGIFGDEAFAAVCTPTRRSALDMARVRATDSDLRIEPPEEALPPMPATVVALASGTHVATRHPSPAGSPAGPAAPRPAAPAVTPTGERTAPATTSPRADTR
ncbi:hypothetical protein ABIQ69_06065 [Agromyces sp. G08B096]|uniref:Flp pilus-assembly TadG-like N-terminal domain-containing protein n=1 Tax=Agromyces sp. G08B096 TaxID=3156399 RepID=A0AAU7W9B1_9MICO